MTKEFDGATLRVMSSYCGGDPRVRRDVEDNVLYEFASESWTLPEFLKLVNDAVAEIPEGLRDTAWVELEGDYESSSSLKIRYRRQETDEEVAKRVASAYAYAREQEAREKAEFERLKKKFA